MATIFIIGYISIEEALFNKDYKEIKYESSYIKESLCQFYLKDSLRFETLVESMSLCDIVGYDIKSKKGGGEYKKELIDDILNSISIEILEKELRDIHQKEGDKLIKINYPNIIIKEWKRIIYNDEEVFILIKG